MSYLTANIRSHREAKRLVSGNHRLLLALGQSWLRAVPCLESKSSHSFDGIDLPHLLDTWPANVLTFAFTSTKVGTRISGKECISLTCCEFSIRHGQRTRWNVQDTGVRLSCVDLIYGMNGVAVPAHVVSWIDPWHVHHGARQVQMWVKLSAKLLTMTWCSTLKP
ncbi:hypothetical protein AC578_6908 [Pseudocercospora eumusae]|uniref:Uncharacterized protein n=1 Tax=Pseudocercospora eumusae TaxID=321146 RepID=A0A139H2J9_9PEZI|nr:hypothetical protein AC578_6908 [Pseudocercospora eumusae]